MKIVLLFALSIGCGGAGLSVPEIEAPTSVGPSEDFSITVSEVSNATVGYWWSVDGEAYPEIEGPDVQQDTPTIGAAWTVIVRLELDGEYSPPAAVTIPIVGMDTGFLSP
jgi:hypothetical protein